MLLTGQLRNDRRVETSPSLPDALGLTRGLSVAITRKCHRSSLQRNACRVPLWRIPCSTQQTDQLCNTVNKKCLPARLLVPRTTPRCCLVSRPSCEELYTTSLSRSKQRLAMNQTSRNTGRATGRFQRCTHRFPERLHLTEQLLRLQTVDHLPSHDQHQSSPKLQNFGGPRGCVCPDFRASAQLCVSMSSRRFRSSSGSFVLSPYASFSTQLALGRPRCINACVLVGNTLLQAGHRASLPMYSRHGVFQSREPKRDNQWRNPHPPHKSEGLRNLERCQRHQSAAAQHCYQFPQIPLRSERRRTNHRNEARRDNFVNLPTHTHTRQNFYGHAGAVCLHATSTRRKQIRRRFLGERHRAGVPLQSAPNKSLFLGADSPTASGDGSA